VVGVILLAQFAVGTHKVGSTEASANSPEAITKRIQPLTSIALEAAPASAAPVKAASPAASEPAKAPKSPDKAAATVASGGEATYKLACSACHAAGVAGAPKLGDKAAWAARVAKGASALHGSALKGLNAMPPKGGNAGLPDAEVKAAVDYMIAQSK
ncbi:MAG TPA: c-type cytochrome, partial [Usitatibacteraceae bacterium]|nr:c-type cytochrome [Usitatibacteraceae bacterium]